MKPVKSVASIEKLPVIQRHKIGIDIPPVQRRSAEDDRHIYAALIHQFEIVAHNERGFNQQTAHADGVSLSLFP